RERRRSSAREVRDRLRRQYRLGAWAIPSLLSVGAKIAEVMTGERAARLLQPATRDKATEIDGLKSEALDQIIDEPLRLWLVSRDKNHATAAVLRGSFVETFDNDRVECLDDAGARREAGHDLARALAAEVGQHEIGTG